MALEVKSSSLFVYPILKIKVSLKYSSNFKSCSNLVINPKGNKTFSRKLKKHRTKTNKFKKVKSQRSRFMRKFRRCGLNSRALVYNVLSLHHASESIATYKGLVNYTTISQPRVFIKKSNKSVHTVLRAPYRYKKGRYQVGTQRYNTVITFFLSIPGLPASSNTFCKLDKGFINLSSMELIKNIILPSFLSFSTNMSTLDSVSLEYRLIDQNFFKLSSYKAN